MADPVKKPVPTPRQSLVRRNIEEVGCEYDYRRESINVPLEPTILVRKHYDSQSERPSNLYPKLTRSPAYHDTSRLMDLQPVPTKLSPGIPIHYSSLRNNSRSSSTEFRVPYAFAMKSSDHIAIIIPTDESSRGHSILHDYEKASRFLKVGYEPHPRAALQLSRQEVDSLAAFAKECHKLRDFETAEQCYRQESALHESNPDMDPSGHAVCCHMLGLTLKELEKPLEARDWFEKALHIRRNDPAGIRTMEESACHFEIALIHKESEDWPKALISLQQALYVARRSAKPRRLCDYDYIGEMLVEIAELYKTMGDTTKAKTCLQNALTLFWETYGSRSPDNFRVEPLYERAAQLCESFGDYKEAENYYKKVLGMMHKRYGKGSDNKQALNAYHNLLRVLKAQKKIKEASQLIMERFQNTSD